MDAGSFVLGVLAGAVLGALGYKAYRAALKVGRPQEIKQYTNASPAQVIARAAQAGCAALLMLAAALLIAAWAMR